jgi:ATP-binding cassette subfamily B protein
MPGQEFFTNVSLVLILAVGAWRVMAGSMSLGTLVAFQSYVMTMWMPVRWIGMINQMAQQAMAAGERVFEILDTRSRSARSRTRSRLPALRGEIAFEHVSFAYGKERPPAVDVDFRAAPGETIAIVRPVRLGQEHDHQPDPALLRRHAGSRS